MREYYSDKWQKKIKILETGDFFATDKDEGLATVVGACISVCIFDDIKHVGGLNHFLVPGPFREAEMFINPAARFGMYAMELLLGELIKLKIDRKNIKAKVFGGAELQKNKSDQTGPTNVSFIRAFLRLEEIPVVSEDLGGSQARKILFFPGSGRVLVSRQSNDSLAIIADEENYRRRIEKDLYS
jgi:chemotaxis protein CheD